MIELETMLKEFHEFYGVPIRYKPELPMPVTNDERQLRVRLLGSEYREYVHAEWNDDLVEIADALADIIYVAVGTAIQYGIPIEEVLKEVHLSNLSKLGEDGEPVLREDGKVLKGPNYFPPDIEDILSKAEGIFG